MIILELRGIENASGGNEVLKNVSMTLQNGQRMGLVGVNGCGKTTLLRIIAGLEEADGGSVSLLKGMRMGYLRQTYVPTPGNTVLEELEQVYEPVRRMEERLRAMEEEMAAAREEDLVRLGEDYARLQERFEKADGYSRHSLVQGALKGMGFGEDRWNQSAEKLSGGEMTRLGLCRLLLEKPDLLLLDEPTNHLDLEALTWLEKYLDGYRGAVIVVSHDRYFLDRVCTDMTEILLGVSEQYAGNYSSYMDQRSARFESRMRAWEQQQQEIARQEAVIARLRSFNREKSIKRAESRVKALEKIERLDKPADEKQIRFSFGVNRRTGEDVLDIRDYAKSFGERVLFEHADLKMSSGDRVALIGPNGIGKTTFLRCLMGLETPDAGTVRWGANIDLGYYDQMQSSLHGEKTVLREVWDDFVRLSQTEVRGALGLFLFTGEDVFMRVADLSGGEKGRLALVKMMLRRDNVLLMDEPTNHLDADSREVLEDALEDFPGTILAVSHDRYFINRFANRVAVLGPDGITVYRGNYDDYIRELERRALGAETEDVPGGLTKTEALKEKRRRKAALEEKKALKARAEEAEKYVAEVEARLEEQEKRMALKENYENPDRARECARVYRELKEELERAYAEWEAAEEAAAGAE